MDATDGDEVVLKDVPSRDLSARSSTRAPARSDASSAKMGGKVVVPKSGTSLVADEHSTAVGLTSNPPTTAIKAARSGWKYREKDEEFQGLLAAPDVVEVAIDLAPGVVEVAIDQAPGVVEVIFDQAPGVVEVAIDQAPGVVEVAIEEDEEFQDEEEEDDDVEPNAVEDLDAIAEEQLVDHAIAEDYNEQAARSGCKYMEKDEEFQDEEEDDECLDQAPVVVEVAVDQAPGVVVVAVHQADQAPLVQVAIDQALLPGDHAPVVQPQGQEDDDGWTVVRSRKYGMVRGLFPDPDIPAPEVRVSDEVVLVPSRGGRRQLRKEKQLRKGGAVMTSNGLATIVYGSYGPFGWEF